MYTLTLSTGIVIRDADGVQIAPCQSADDPDFVEYVQWCEAGNQPTIAAEIAVGSRVITKYAFRQRLTFAEKMGIDTSADAGVIVFRNDFAVAEEVNLDTEAVVQGLAYLEGIGLLAPGRAAEIRA